MTDTIHTTGSFDDLVHGDLTIEAQAYVLTVSKSYLADGWPEWSYRASNPLDRIFTQNLDDLRSGSAKIYNGNPVSFVVPAGKFDMGNAGSLAGFVTDYLGTFEDFAVYPTTDTDPVLVGWIDYRSPRQVTAPTGAITTAWRQGSLLMYPPKNARYIVPQVTVGSVPAGSSVYLDAFDIRVTPAFSDPTVKPVYAAPRNLTVKVKPTRLNLSVSPDFVDNNILSGLQIVPDNSRPFYSGHVECGHVIIQTTGVVSAQEDTSGLPIEVVPGESLKVAYKYLLVGYPTGLFGTYRIRVDFLTEHLDVVSTVYSDTTIHDTVRDWTDISLFTTVPDGATRARIYRVYSDNASAGEDFYVDGCLIERGGQEDAEFFDGSFDPAEYLWKQGGTPFSTWSYYYQDRLARNYILTRLLEENVPLGMKVDQPQYGVWTP